MNLAKICEKKKIILAQTSTHAVFEGNKRSQYNESDFQDQITFIVHQNLLQNILYKLSVQNIMFLDFPQCMEKEKINF